MNVGSGGGAAAAPTSGGAASGDAPAEETKEEPKEEGTKSLILALEARNTDLFDRQGRVGRGHGFRSLRLDYLSIFHLCTSHTAIIGR